MHGFTSGLSIYPVPLIYISVFVPILCYFDYCGFVILFEVRETDSSNSIFLSQECFGYSGSFLCLSVTSVQLLSHVRLFATP